MRIGRPIAVPEARDGLLWVPPHSWGVIPHSGTTWTLSRTAAGNYNLSRTSAGAETHYLYAFLPGVTRHSDAAGLKPFALVLAYTVATAAATTVTVACKRALYVDRVAVAVADFGGTLTFDTNHDTNAKRITTTAGDNPHVLKAVLGTEQYQDTDDALVSLDLTLDLPNTCVFTLLGGGFRVAHNYF